MSGIKWILNFINDSFSNFFIFFSFFIFEFSATFNRIRVVFAADSYRPIYRVELYSHKAFLANVGGLFGLFIGASVLSFIEFIYYFTLYGFSSSNNDDGIQKIETAKETNHNKMEKRTKSKKKKKNKKKPQLILHNELRLRNSIPLFPYTP